MWHDYSWIQSLYFSFKHYNSMLYMYVNIYHFNITGLNIFFDDKSRDDTLLECLSYALFFLLVVVHLLVGVRKQSRPVSLHAPWDCHYITRCLLLLNPATTREYGLQKWWGHDAICNFASFQNSMLYAIEDRSCLAIAFFTLTGEESDLH